MTLSSTDLLVQILQLRQWQMGKNRTLAASRFRFKHALSCDAAFLTCSYKSSSSVNGKWARIAPSPRALASCASRSFRAARSAANSSDEGSRVTAIQAAAGDDAQPGIRRGIRPVPSNPDHEVAVAAETDSGSGNRPEPAAVRAGAYSCRTLLPDELPDPPSSHNDFCTSGFDA
eukprot:CAMPEP_0119343876 /NCGR_PEP_ID=MMETSP1333-20130426/106680_1 /TAXON_ID=418940 /ORGANISM="Scyphosphaera apsteinii, Strain RCC1455" /LENGTH=173 /DNA_ID=CAMNT_0007356293 /DNA_START=675 /DNA_END=1197 /DNA_ORIENTATION=-